MYIITVDFMNKFAFVVGAAGFLVVFV